MEDCSNIYVHLTIPLLSSINKKKIIFFGLVTNASSDFVTVSTLNLIENCLLSVVSRDLNYEHLHLTIHYVKSQIVFLLLYHGLFVQKLYILLCPHFAKWEIDIFLFYYGLFAQKIYILLCPHSDKWKIVLFLLYHGLFAQTIYISLCQH